MPSALISLEQVTIRVGKRWILPDTTWHLQSGQQWVVLGANGSGKSSLVRCLLGELPAVQGRLVRHDPTLKKERMGYVSFELHQRLVGRDTARDLARDFSARFNDYSTVESLLGPAAESPEVNRVSAMMQIEALLTRPIRYLSSGEMRKVLIARALMRDPKLLILDEPYEGLDIEARKHLSTTIDDLIRSGVPTILVTHRFDEIPKGVTHVCGLKDGRLIVSGPRETVLTAENVAQLYPEFSQIDSAAMPTFHQTPEEGAPNVLVEIRKATVAYGSRRIFDGLNWRFQRGQHWALLGPNGSGKSSLLGLITGDNLQGYANEIFLFGRKKGSGESLWEIRQRIGVVSQHLQVGYLAAVSGAEVVVSGFFDSIGLYRKASPGQKDRAAAWIRQLGIKALAHRCFDTLSNGEKRMLLIARALVKEPLLLILDEPCQGLDPENRRRVNTIIDRIGSRNGTHLLYVSHRQEEIPDCITHVLSLDGKGFFECNPKTSGYPPHM